MGLLILAPTEEELAALFPKDMRSHLPKEVARPCALLSNHLAIQPVYTTLCGVGPVNAGIALGASLGELQSRGIALDTVLLCGLAGSYDLTKAPLCSLWNVTEELYPEYGLNDGHTVVAEAFTWPQWKDSPKGTIANRIPLDDITLLTKDPKDIQSCLGITVAGVSASFERTMELRERYHATVENMEGFAVALGCLRFGVRCLQIRSISNKVGPRKASEKDFLGALDRLGDILPTLNLI
ncbi:MAG: futalosine hydrolase [Desulfovibrio sp.]|nr:futalosine hydrolase [Desulfovibrio sp.]